MTRLMETRRLPEGTPPAAFRSFFIVASVPGILLGVLIYLDARDSAEPIARGVQYGPRVGASLVG